MTDALFGHTGFVGSNLARQRPYDFLYNSANAHEARGREFGTVVCAAAPGEKWRANLDPRTDWIKISALISTLREVSCDHFVLISTVDVHDGSAYGRHRGSLECEVQTRFPSALILRLPALFGPGLRKNPLYDLMHRHRTDQIAPNATYQWWPVDDLDDVIRMCHAPGAITLTSDPITMRELRDRFFPGMRLGPERADAPNYAAAIKPGIHIGRDEIMRRIGEFVGAE